MSRDCFWPKGHEKYRGKDKHIKIEPRPDTRPEWVCDRCGKNFKLIKHVRCMRCGKTICRKCIKVIFASPSKEISTVSTVKTLELCKEECWQEVWEEITKVYGNGWTIQKT